MKYLLFSILLFLSIGLFSQTFEKHRHYIAERIVVVDYSVDSILDATDVCAQETLSILRRSEDYSNVRYFVEGFYFHLYVECFLSTFEEMSNENLNVYFLTTENASYLYKMSNIDVINYLLESYDSVHPNDSYVKYFKTIIR
jgi:hypothetical protein